MDEKHEKHESPDSGTPQGTILTSPDHIKPQARKTHDPDVTFEEYYYYAQRTREEQRHYAKPRLNVVELLGRKKDKSGEPELQAASTLTASDFANRATRMEISDEEWTNASRAFRTASMGACE